MHGYVFLMLWSMSFWSEVIFQRPKMGVIMTSGPLFSIVIMRSILRKHK